MPFPLFRVLVHGPSMAPTLRHGDHLLVRRAVTAEPGQLVVVRRPDGPFAVKRLTRHDEAGIWVEGDNPYGSTDSRDWGALPHDSVEGVVIARLWPHPRRFDRRTSSFRTTCE